MGNLKRISLLVGLAFNMAVLFAGISSAQGLKIGFVKDEVIKQRFTGWQRAQEQWEVQNKAWDDEAMTKQEEIEQLLEEYEKQKLILSDEKRKEKEASIRAKQEALDAFTRQTYGPGGTAETKHAQLLKPLLEQATAAIEAVALEGDYDIIFTGQSALGYIKESFDVTEKVIEYLEKTEQ